jgi:hypothetical protein
MSNGFGEDLLEKGQSLARHAAKTVGQDIEQQVVGSKQQMPGAEQLAGGQQQGSTQDQTAIDAQNKANQDFLKDLYGTSNNQSSGTSAQPAHTPVQQDLALDDQQKLAEARKALNDRHMQTYYIPTFVEQKKTDESTQERLEKEEQEEKAKKMEKLQEEEEKKPIPQPVKGPEKAPGAG